MEVTVRLYGNLRRYASNRQDRTVVNVPDSETIEGLLGALGVPDSAWWMAAVNDKVVQRDAVLQAGDLVEIFEPVGGG